jgi:8-oxo-dGTP diphosphatase
MEFTVHPFQSFQDYTWVDIMALYQDKWIFCKHQKRAWENPGGHIEAGETPLEAAKRELYEETGAIDFTLEPLCDYRMDATVNDIHYVGNGQVYFATVHVLGDLPEYSEMEKIKLCESFPEDLTFTMSRNYYPLALEKKGQTDAPAKND